MTIYDSKVREYLEQEPVTVRSTLRGPAALVSRLTPPSLRMPVRAFVTRLLAPVSRRRLMARVAHARRSGAGVYLHLGCGPEHKPDFINIDLLGARVDVPWDLSQPLPLPDDSVDGIYHEHVLGHIPTRVGYALLAECRRVLRPGGVLRAAVPDAGALLDSYAGTGSPGWAEAAPVPMMAVENLFYEHKLIAVYDEEKLQAFLSVAGFSEISRRGFGETELPICPDTPRRREGTLYVEAVK